MPPTARTRQKPSRIDGDPHADSDGVGRTNFVCYECSARCTVLADCDCESCTNVRKVGCACGLPPSGQE